MTQWWRIRQQFRRCKRFRFHPWVRKIPWNREWQATSVFLPWESHGQRSLVGYSPWGHTQSDTTQPAHMPFIHWASDTLASFLILYHSDTQSNCTLKSHGALKKYQALEWSLGIGIFRMFFKVIKWAAMVESQSINTKSSFLLLDLILVVLSTWSASEIARSHFRHHLLREDDSDILLRWLLVFSSFSSLYLLYNTHFNL